MTHTLQELTDLPDEELRRMLAEILYPQFPVKMCNPGGLRHQYPGGRSGPVANYPEDLNACHYVERWKFGEPWWSNYGDYLTQLRAVIRAGYNPDGPKLPITACATARQRTVALVLTLQK